VPRSNDCWEYDRGFVEALTNSAKHEVKMKSIDEEINLANCLTDPRWQTYQPKQVVPHTLRVLERNGGKVVALVARRGRRNDWGINVGAMTYVAAGEREGKIAAGFVVIADGTTVINSAPVEVVLARVAGLRPLSGELGDYFWFNSELMPVTSAGANQAEAW
jgi:hypothetical protein